MARTDPLEYNRPMPALLLPAVQPSRDETWTTLPITIPIPAGQDIVDVSISGKGSPTRGGGISFKARIGDDHITKIDFFGVMTRISNGSTPVLADGNAGLLDIQGTGIAFPNFAQVSIVAYTSPRA